MYRIVWTGIEPRTIVKGVSDIAELLGISGSVPYKERRRTAKGEEMSADEMERLMLANMPVDDNDVSELAEQRGLAAKEYLSETAGVSPERLFIVGARVEPSGAAADCAAAFTLN